MLTALDMFLLCFSGRIVNVFEFQQLQLGCLDVVGITKGLYYITVTTSSGYCVVMSELATDWPTH